MTGHSLSFLDAPAVSKIVGNAGATKTVVANSVCNARAVGASPYHTPRILAAHAISGQFTGTPTSASK